MCVDPSHSSPVQVTDVNAAAWGLSQAEHGTSPGCTCSVNGPSGKHIFWTQEVDIHTGRTRSNKKLHSIAQYNMLMLCKVGFGFALSTKLTKGLKVVELLKSQSAYM